MKKGVIVGKPTDSSKLMFLLLIIAVIALIVLFILRNNGPNNGEELIKLTSNVEISNVRFLNDTDINIEINKPKSEDNLDSIIFIFYDESGSKIRTSRIPIERLKTENFEITFHFTDLSDINKISITPVFRTNAGLSVQGKVEDEYSVSSNQENNQSDFDEYPENDISKCTKNSQCEDHNNCTANICLSNGSCSYVNRGNCVPCDFSYQCEDSNACTTNKCMNGVCIYLQIPNCVTCYSAIQCQDNNSCTEDICFSGRCMHNKITNCTSTTPINNQSNVTNNTQPILECLTSSDCDDYDSCTRNLCSLNKCVYTSITTCTSNDGCCPSGRGCTFINDNDCLPVCGNNIKEGEEQCDGTYLGGATCAGVLGVGYTGNLFCSDCRFNSSLCVPPCSQTCESLGYKCGNRVICGKVINCGNCQDGYICDNNGTCMNRCISESSASLCNRLDKDCGSATGVDNCGVRRTVDCGGCLDGQTCSSGQCVTSTQPPPAGNGNTYYVSTSGSDSNSGTLSQPWRTWQKAFTSISVQPGDTVYFRGGVYPMTVANGEGYTVTRGGTRNNWVTYANYPGEIPILDCGNVVQTVTWSHAIYTSRDIADYIIFRGLTVRNVLQNPNLGRDNNVVGFGALDGHLIYENCVAYNVHGHGFRVEFYLTDSSGEDDEVRYINCDSYDNVDIYAYPPGLPGNGGDGFASYNWFSPYGRTIYRNCRAWGNGDQGFSMGENYIEIDNCWSFDNGVLQGGGHGYKLGWVSFPYSDVRHVITNSIAANNRESGFITNDVSYPNICHMNLYNNLAYHNGYKGYNAPGFWVDNTAGSDSEELKRVFRNNVAYDNQYGPVLASSSALYTHSHNSWDSSGITLSAADFVSLDVSQLMRPRKADGSLPDITFGHLKSDSDLINKGVNVGLPYSGSYPDLGAFEYTGSGSSTPAITCTDADNDGYSLQGGECGAKDCNDNNAAINPNAAEICGNSVDEDCDGQTKACDLDITKYTDSETGHEVWRMTNNPSLDIMQYYHHPTMSPDGKYLIFRSNRAPSYLYIMDSDGSNEKSIGDYDIWNRQRGIDFSANNLQGWFSNDGKKYYTYNKLYEIDIDKFEQGKAPSEYIRQISSAYANNFYYPMVSPDGRKLFGVSFVADSDSGGTLKIINIDGTGYKEYVPPVYAVPYIGPALDVTHGWVGNDQGWYMNNDLNVQTRGGGAELVFNTSNGAKASDYPSFEVLSPTNPADEWYGYIGHFTVSPSAYFIGKGEGTVAGHGSDYKVFNTKYWSQNPVVREQLILADSAVSNHYAFSHDAKYLTAGDYLGNNKGMIIAYPVSTYSTPIKIARFTSTDRAGTFTVNSDPTFSPDNTKLIYLGDIREARNYDLYMAVFKKPEVPTAFNGVGTGDKLKFTWKPAVMHREIKSYEIYKSSTQNGAYSKVATVPEVITFVDAPSKITSIQTTIYVDSTEGFASSGIIEIFGLSSEKPTELVRYTGKTATSFTGCTRGVLGTIPAEHYNDAFVWKYTGDIGHVIGYSPGYYKIKSVEWSGLASEFSNSIYVA